MRAPRRPPSLLPRANTAASCVTAARIPPPTLPLPSRGCAPVPGGRPVVTGPLRWRGRHPVPSRRRLVPVPPRLQFRHRQLLHRSAQVPDFQLEPATDPMLLWTRRRFFAPSPEHRPAEEAPAAVAEPEMSMAGERRSGEPVRGISPQRISM